MPNDRAYLNHLRERWLACIAPERNKLANNNEVNLTITTSNSGPSDFYIPDLSGEIFEMQYESRTVSNKFIRMLNSAKGILLFINPDTLQQPVLISEVRGIEIQNTDAQIINTPVKPVNDWNHKNSPTQVVLVDLLQISSLFLKTKIKISIIISAWDTIIDSQDTQLRDSTPDKWLDKELPLLSQFLISNPQNFKHKVFGVSAQGSSYEESNSKLQDILKPSDRIRVHIESTPISNDITLPIKWLLNE